MSVWPNDIGTSEVHEPPVHERERKFYYIGYLVTFLSLSVPSSNLEIYKRVALCFI